VVAEQELLDSLKKNERVAAILNPFTKKFSDAFFVDSLRTIGEAEGYLDPDRIVKKAAKKTDHLSIRKPYEAEDQVKRLKYSDEFVESIQHAMIDEISDEKAVATLREIFSQDDFVRVIELMAQHNSFLVKTFKKHPSALKAFDYLVSKKQNDGSNALRHMKKEELDRTLPHIISRLGNLAHIQQFSLGADALRRYINLLDIACAQSRNMPPDFIQTYYRVLASLRKKINSTEEFTV
jgi:hypothetical protein